MYEQFIDNRLFWLILIPSFLHPFLSLSMFPKYISKKIPIFQAALAEAPKKVLRQCDSPHCNSPRRIYGKGVKSKRIK